ncbi:MAG: hypothetical protein QNJ70_21615 [Xenococcaceae cyanobacterium MO_207.B15]|nr:hypothetical protein [Xenococcaceae cyanobacterium MO_207.B15]
MVTDFVEESFGVVTGKITGFDFGLKTFLTVSDGTPIKSPLFFNQFRSLLRKANKNLSSKLTLPMGRGRKSLFFKLDLDFIPGAVSLVWNRGERTSY